MLRDQWIEEVEELYNMPVGIIGSGEYDIDHSIVVGNIQTLIKVLPQIAKEFGTVIIDEAHHCPATSFTSFIDGMYARYKIGLSGTMKRKDGRHILFKDFFGPKLLQPPENGTMVPSVRIMQTGVGLSPGDGWAVKINKLLYDTSYQQFIASVAKIQVAKGHRVLIVADRVEFLQNVKELIGEECVCVTGDTDFETRKRIKKQVNSGEKTSVAGSRQIISEGWSVNSLSCVILAGPISAPSEADGLLEQVVGRIQRNFPGKLEPLVLDMNFNDPPSRKQNLERLNFYKRQGWEIKS
jgi:superfamily II DNA or RNA helicase